ncbi:hypothetical protein ACOME3_002911 [Neoechinorhynchus agilis]
MSCPQVESEVQLDAVDKFLESRSYIVGFEPSSVDLFLLDHIKVSLTDKHVNLKRWHSHMNSFDQNERAKFHSIKCNDLSKFGLNIPPSNNDDDDIDLFASDTEEDTAEQERIKQERIAMYEQKKATKTKAAAKSNVVFDVKPWEDSTDLVEMERRVRNIQMDGLSWGASKLVPVAFGIKKLQISTVIEDEKVSTDVLEEKIMELEDFVQSVDIVSFNKL